MTPAINIRYATEADIPALGIVNYDAFASTIPYANAFPHAAPGSVRSYKAAQSLKHLVNPRMHALAGCDPASDEVIAYCRWIIPHSLGYDREAAPLSEQGKQDMADPMRLAPQSMNEAVYQAFRSMVEEKRRQYTTEDDIILDFLATLPAHQGKGIASILLQWGLQKADALGRRVYLEATLSGYPLYLRSGWTPVEEVTFDFKPLGGDGSDKFVIMIREPR